MEAPVFQIEAIEPRLVVRCRCRACSMLPPGPSLAAGEPFSDRWVLQVRGQRPRASVQLACMIFADPSVFNGRNKRPTAMTRLRGRGGRDRSGASRGTFFESGRGHCGCPQGHQPCVDWTL